METVKILGANHYCGYDERNYKNFSKMTDKKVEAMDRMRDNAIPAWYRKACKYIPLLEKAIRVGVEWQSPKREVIKIFFFGKYKDEVHILYF